MNETFVVQVPTLFFVMLKPNHWSSRKKWSRKLHRIPWRLGQMLEASPYSCPTVYYRRLPINCWNHFGSADLFWWTSFFERNGIMDILLSHNEWQYLNNLIWWRDLRRTSAPLPNVCWNLSLITVTQNSTCSTLAGFSPTYPPTILSIYSWSFNAKYFRVLSQRFLLVVPLIFERKQAMEMLSPKLPALYFVKNYPIVFEGPSRESTIAGWNIHFLMLIYFKAEIT